MTISLPIVSTFDNKGIKRAQDALKQFGSFAADVAKIGASAVAAVGVAGIREAAAFETSIAKIEGLVGVAGDELDKLSAAARRLGPATGKSAKDAADALFVISSAGLRGADAVEALELSLKASAAGLGETEDIARSVAGALNAYGTDVVDAAKATDVIVATARAGNFETSQFAAAIGRVLPFAQQAGASLEDMGGAVALLTRTNGDAAQSVTQVTALFRAFVVPTQEAKKSLEAVGLSAQDMRDAIATQGLPEALAMLDDKLSGNREELGRLLGSSEAAAAAFQILDADAQTVAGTFGVVNDAAGMTNEAFNVVSDTAQQRFNVAMAGVKDLLLGIGQDLIERLLPYLDQFQTFMENNGPQIQAAFDNIYAAVELVVGKVADFIAGLQAKPEFQEFLVLLSENYDEIAASVESVITTILDLADNVFPYLIEIINENFPTLQALVSIFDDLSYFLGEVIDGLDGTSDSTDNVVQTFLDALTPLGRARDVIQSLADALDAVRRAYEKLKGKTGLDFKFNEDFVRNPYIQPRAVGGSVMGRNAYLVGERGPELFVPSGSGQIMAAGQTAKMGGGPTYNVTVQAGVGDPVAIGREVVSAIKRFERVSGPVFASA